MIQNKLHDFCPLHEQQLPWSFYSEVAMKSSSPLLRYEATPLLLLSEREGIALLGVLLTAIRFDESSL